MMNTTDLYAITREMTRERFEQLLLMLIAAGLGHLDGSDESGAYYIGGYETLGHQLSCLIAQRFITGVGTSETVEALKLDRTVFVDDRAALISQYLDSIGEELNCEKT